MKNYIWYSLAAICEIAGCFSFWAWLRLEKNGMLIIPDMLSLALFAFLLTRVDLNANAAGRAYAAYGGIYIVASLMWLWLAEDMRPDRWDIFGAGVCLIGMAIILFGRHST